MGGVHDCFSDSVDACYAPYRVQCVDISIVPVVVLSAVRVGVCDFIRYHLCRNRCWVNVGDKAYGNSAFEMEAKSNEMIDGYLDVRMPFEFFRYYEKI